MRLMRGAIGAAVVALAVAACGPIPGPPPALDDDFIPSIAPSYTPDAAVGTDGFTREEHLAVRVRVDACDGWATGSGWILDATHVVTNRHVVEGATRIQVTTYDGQDFDVTDSRITTVADLALLTVTANFTEAATYEARDLTAGDAISVVGYPDGQQLHTENGIFVSTTVDTVGDTGELVWGLRAHVEHGNSGSPVFAEDGTVVAVLYAGDEEDGSLAWPIQWFQDAQDQGLWQANPPGC